MPGKEDYPKKKRRRVDHIDAYSIDTYAGEGQEQIEGVKAVVYALVFLAILITFHSAAPLLLHLFTSLDQHVPNKFLLGQFVALGTLLAGILLYCLREYKRMLYALVELSFAIVTGGTAISKVKDGEFSVWLALAASTYLVVRGLENLHKAGFVYLDRLIDQIGKLIFVGRRHSQGTVTVSMHEETKQ